MDDYISREAAIKKFEDAEYLYDPEPGAKRYTVEDAKEILNDVPAADVRPVVRGHWIGEDEAEKIFEENYSDYPYGNCSVCGHCDWDCVESEGFNYCPNCGAEMTGVQNG